MNSGIRRQDIPGARELRSVAIMLIAKQTKPSRASAKPISQASTAAPAQELGGGERRQRGIPASEGRQRKLA